MKRLLLVFLAIALLAGGFFAWRFYSWIFFPNTPGDLEGAILMVPKGSTIESIKDSLYTHQYILNGRSFTWVADRMSFTDDRVKSGRYLVDADMSNKELVERLRAGEQAPVKLVITPTLTFEQLASKIADQLMMDSSELVRYVKDTFLAGSEFSDNDLISMFIPNTYEVYWNTSPESLTGRLKREHDRFWTAKRRGAADKIGLTPVEVYTLASIVERETHIPTERPVVAGLYLNRLKKNMPLQSDPTIMFANGDYTIKRVLFKHLEVESPYNTYKYPGLPPGPISMASISSIDAVLYPGSHNYYYMCAKPGAGGHVFAETLNQHNRNARDYQRWLNQEGIR